MARSRSMKAVLIALLGALVLAGTTQAGTTRTTAVQADLAGSAHATGALAAQAGTTRIQSYVAGSAHATGALGPAQAGAANSWWHHSRTDLAASHMSAGRVSVADCSDDWNE